MVGKKKRCNREVRAEREHVRCKRKKRKRKRAKAPSCVQRANTFETYTTTSIGCIWSRGEGLGEPALLRRFFAREEEQRLTLRLSFPTAARACLEGTRGRPVLRASRWRTDPRPKLSSPGRPPVAVVLGWASVGRQKTASQPEQSKKVQVTLCCGALGEGCRIRKTRTCRS